MTRLAEIIRDSKNIVFFGGAGVSTESGIPDFRSANGIFNQNLGRILTAEEMVSHSFYKNHPRDFFNFYRDKLIYPEARPNSCHKALAKLEEIGKVKSVITQNIDGLHQMAGSKKVVELHGSVHRSYCVDCGEGYNLEEFLTLDELPLCKKCSGIVRPDVVLYQESLNDQVLRQAVLDISQADTLIVGGTSLVVYPAAGLINYFRGRRLVLINMTRTNYDRKADLCIYDKIGVVFKEAMEDLNLAL